MQNNVKRKTSLKMLLKSLKLKNSSRNKSHINKQTTYENPLMQQQQQQQSNTFTTTNSRPASSMKTFKPSTSTLNSLGAKYMNGNGNGNGDTTPTQPRQHQQTIKTTTTSSQNIYFTQNPDELRGEFIKTSLLKTAQGFGFTIIGANETSEDFLQIKYIVPDGAADRDGMLRQGDVLVYVNNECVLGYTHQDVVEIFQVIIEIFQVFKSNFVTNLMYKNRFLKHKI